MVNILELIGELIMAMSKGLFETLDSEIVGKQTISDILYWILGGVLAFDFVTGGIIFTTWFSNFGLSAKAFAGVQIVLIAYCAAMVFGESKAVKNIITTVGFWTLLLIATTMTNSNSKIIQTYESIKGGVGGLSTSGNYYQTPQGLVNPPPQNVPPQVNNVQANIQAWKKKAVQWGFCPTGVKLNKAQLADCKVNGNTTTHYKVNCGTMEIHNPPGQKGCPAN